jgi:hypothetical protein
LAGISASDLEYSFRDSTYGFFTIPSDGTPRGDSARRILAAAFWDLEGGEYRRGARLLKAGLHFGVGHLDQRSYRTADDLLMVTRDQAEQFRLYDEVSSRWPNESWPWERRATALARLGRVEESRAAMARAIALSNPR